MSTIRAAFVEEFGEAQAIAIEAAAEEHANGINSQNKGSDHFRWAITICLGYECMSKEKYRVCHHISAPWDQLKDWIKCFASLDQHDGDVDYLALFVGTYDEFMPGAKS